MQQLLPHQLAKWLADESRSRPTLLDVREEWEFELCHLPGALHMPMHLVPVRCAEVPVDQEVVVICHHGARSLQVAMFLERQGYRAIYNLMGGVDGWASDVDTDFRRY